MIWATALVARNVLGYKMFFIQISYCQTKRKEKMQKYEILSIVPNKLEWVNKTKSKWASCLVPAYLVSNSNLCRNISSIREGGGRDQQQQRDRQALDRVLLNKQVPEEQMPGHCHCPTILASHHFNVSQFSGTNRMKLP